MSANFLPDSVQERVIAYMQKKCPANETSRRLSITINFHPDRRTLDDVPVMEAIARDGLLKSQFETQTSNGGLTAFSGGERWIWEQRAFGGLYDHCSPPDRPKYGALNYRPDDYGASPRFGSAYFVLKSSVIDRTTFCYPDSYFNPADFGVGRKVEHLMELAESDERDLLDNYIEAHIHGPVFLESDIEALVLDPSYRNTSIESMARNLPCSLQWHKGFRVKFEVFEQNSSYRGSKYVEIARVLALDGVITPDILGKAVEKQLYTSQDVKKVWHYLARFGYGNNLDKCYN